MPIKFDMKDPETKATVGGWDAETEYVVKTGDDPTTGVVDAEEPEEAEPTAAEGSPGESESAPGPAAVKAAMAG
jgi:hypothetical protein